MHRTRPAIAPAVAALCALPSLAAAQGVQLLAVLNDTGELYQIDAATGAAANLGPIDPLDGFFASDPFLPIVGALDVAPDGRVIAVQSGGGLAGVYEIDVDAVTASLIGLLNDDGPASTFAEGGLAFDAAGTAWGIGAIDSVPSLYTIDLATGLGTPQLVIDTGSFLDYSGLHIDEQGRFLALRRDAGGFTNFSLVEIDGESGASTVIADLDAQGVALGGVAGFTAVGGTGYFISGVDTLSGLIPGDGSLYSVDLATGDVTFIADLTSLVPTGPASFLGFAGLAVLPAASGPCNPADIDGSGELTFADVTAFINAFNAGDTAADVDGTPGVSFGDVIAFIEAFNDGCP